MRHTVLMLMVDLFLITLATLFALMLRDNLEIIPERVLALLPYLGVTLGVAAPILIIFRLNRSIWRLSVMMDYGRVISAVAFTVPTVVALCFLINRLDEVARSLPVLQAILMIILLVGVRVLIRQRHVFRTTPAPASIAQQPTETVLIVGLNRITELYLQSVAEFAPGRIRISGLLGRSERHTGRLVQRQVVLGMPEETKSVLKRLEVHGVFVDRIVVTTAFERLSQRAQQALLEIEKNSNIKLDLFAERTRIEAPSEIAQPSFGGISPTMREDVGLSSLKALSRPWWSKRLPDCVIAAALIIVLSPVALLVAFLAFMDVGPAILFWQQRPGLRGSPFKLFKFCTMRTAYDAHGLRRPDGERVSFIGRFLRRTRLDEIPQLYNILIGDMSFVGPRPLLPADQPAAYAARLLVRPGLTGWAQVQGGREISPADKAALDLWYVRKASPILDFKILALTAPMVIMGERVNSEAIKRAWRELTTAGVYFRSDAASQRSVFTSGAEPKQAA